MQICCPKCLWDALLAMQLQTKHHPTEARGGDGGGGGAAGIRDAGCGNRPDVWLC